MNDTYKKFVHNMRLDLYLVREKLVASRSRAQRAIKSGLVAVDNRTILKPSFEVTYDNTVIVAPSIDKPAGYWKLKRIQEAVGLIKNGDVVLDIGSSAGGFLWYAAEFAEKVYAVEFSSSFKQLLDDVVERYFDKVLLTYADAFSFDFTSFGVEFDVILNDVTAAPKDSLELLLRSSAALKADGRVLQVFKGKTNDLPLNDFLQRFEEFGLKTLEVITGQKKELYVIAEKCANRTNAEEGI
jgi:23S rRNA (cytidine1920-2'-O)/16S rRNA (cytidine1409-2'-O)-methyltransferase